MTICLAAAATENVIVTVSDRRIAWTDDGTPSADDGTLKTALIAKTWGVMFSGNDLRPVLGILDDIKSRLKATKGKQTKATVAAAAEAAYRVAFEKRFVGERLSRYGFCSMEQFRRDGLGVFGSELLANFNTEIDKFSLGIELLVYGFDEGPPFGRSHIFLVENPGFIQDCDMVQYGIIGSGYHAALSTLLHKPFQRTSLTQVVWRLCEAKFSAEAAHAVGKETSVIVLPEDGQVTMMPPSSILALRKVWEDQQRAGVPEKANIVIAEAFKRLVSDASYENI